MLIAGCENLRNNHSPKEEERPTDICTSGLSMFHFNDEELSALTRVNKNNALLLNCTLHKACGFKINTPEVCSD